MTGWRGWLCPLVPEHGPLLYIEGNEPRPWHCPHHGHHVAGTRSLFSTDEAERRVVPTPGVPPETPTAGKPRGGIPVSDGTPAAAARVPRRRSAVPSGSPGGALPAGGRGAAT